MIKHIEIPSRLSHKLQTDSRWILNVEKINLNIVDYFYRTPYFFPEYTDHGVIHLKKVLEICDKLIPDYSMDKLTAKEIGIIIISVMIHDIGMFIQKDGLKELLYGTLKNEKVEFLDVNSWEQTWQDYVQTVKRYSDKKLLKIFGDSEPIQIPDEHMSNLNEKDILLYGDFLRTMHGRLAHTIAREGFLGSEKMDIFRGTELDDTTRDLIGLIARSHCMALRDCKEYLDTLFSDIKRPKNIAVFYVMALLRIADYLDAGYDRASHVIASMQCKKSVISYEEYSWNSIIDYDDYEWDFNAKKLVIHANPRNSNEFLKIEDWLKNVQKEIDMSWAVLGEYYGINDRLDITIRRLDSNILKRETRKNFERKFVTRKAVLDTNPDILGLLIFPLYDNNPRYGIREILQNAIDACKERKILENNKKEDYFPRINLEVNTIKNTITITDNGIGMDEDVIINYFLVSGASFRNSELWSKYFTVDENSLVSRTGKFGIGALAIFLIGGRATIKTKKARFNHLDDYEKGYLFDIEVSKENISIERIESDVGTQITIWTNKETIEKIVKAQEYPKWCDWYCFDEPVVHYYIDDNEIIHEEEFVPDEREEFPDWYVLNVKEFKSYKWSYKHQIIEDINSYCNGIPIPRRCILSGKKYGFDLEEPVISIVDFEDNIEVNLSRSQLCSFPCEKQFIKEGYKYAIAQLLCVIDIVNIDDFWKFYDNGYPWCKEFGYKRTSEIIPGAYVLSKIGYTLMSPAFIYNINIRRITVIFVKTDYMDLCRDISIDDPIYICCVGNRKRRTFFMDIFQGIFNDDLIEEKPLYFDVEKSFFDGELYVLFDKFNLLEKMRLSEENETYYRYRLEDSSLDKKEIQQRKMPTKENKQCILATLTYDICYKETISNTMTGLLSEYLKEGWIPYGLDERKSKYSSTFKQLEKYMN